MPVSTRSNISITNETPHNTDAEDAMTDKNKPLTLQDVINTINNLETKLNNKIENKFADLQLKQDTANKEIKDKLDKLDTIETNLMKGFCRISKGNTVTLSPDYKNSVTLSNI